MEHLAVYIKNSSNLSCRDKAFRLMQYTSKFIGHAGMNRSYNKELLQRLKQFEATLSLSRKTFRVAKTIDALYGALKATSVRDPYIRSCIILSRLSRACYFTYDTINWFMKSGLVNGDAKKWSVRSAPFWFGAVFMCVLRDLYELKKYLDQHKEKRQQDFDVLIRHLVINNLPVIVDLIKNLFDIVIALSLWDKVSVSDGLVGVAGMISSSAGLLEIFCPCYKLVPS